jgi:hypothetical protein
VFFFYLFFASFVRVCVLFDISGFTWTYVFWLVFFFYLVCVQW